MSQFLARHSVASVLLAIGVCPFAAAADILDFNDLGPSTVGTRMPSPYASLRWDSSVWHYMTLASNPSNTFLALSGTGTFVGSVPSGDFIGGPDFYFDGADFWSRRGADANGDFYFALYHDGVRVYNGLDEQDGRQRFSNVPQRLVPEYSGPVDGIAIAFDNDDWDHLAMDNFAIRWIESPCPADTSGSTDPGDPAYGKPDGAVDSADFFHYLDQFVAGNLAAADLTGSSDPNDPAYGVPDGMLDATDFFHYLDLFVQGCP